VTRKRGFEMDHSALVSGFIMGIQINLPFATVGLIIYFVKRVASKSVS